MDTSKIIKGVVNGRNYTVTAPIVKEDYGLVLQIEGVELPSSYQVDFSNSENNGTSVTMIGNADGVLIPHQFISTGKDVFAFLYHVGEDFGRTVYKFRIPNKLRPDRTNEEPTPEEQSIIDQTISALNDAVEQAQEAQEAIEDMSVSAQTLAEGESATVTKTESEGVVHLEFGIPKGQTGDSPTITASKTGKTTSIYVDGSEVAQIEDGTDGINGIDGISPSVSVTDITGGHRVVITDKDGEKSFDVEDGATGATPNLTIGTVETLEPAESATASITGTPENPVLNLGIPQGEQGEVTLEDYYKAFPTDTASGAVASFTDGADDLPLKSLVVDINPVQDLHGQESPYPAGGGKNKANYPALITAGAVEQDDGSLYVARASSFSNIKAWENDGTTGQFAVTFTIKNDGASRGIYPIIKYTDSTEESLHVNTGTTTYTTYTKISNNSKTVDCVYFKYGSSAVKNWFYIQVESGSTATSWSPYENICPISGWTGMQLSVNGTVIPISWQTEAGTVYGGTLDVLSGVMTAYPYYASYNGETLTGRWISDRDVYAVGTTPTIGAQVVNIGAEGTEYQLTPHEVNSLLGANNIFADTGDTSCEYRADTKLYINRLTEPDADMIADSNIVSGQYFMVGNSLFKATANIANGSAIIVGTNCIRKSLSEALNEINA